jgi:cytochrome P450
MAPSEGVNAMGYFLPEGTVMTTQSLSMSRQRPDLFPNCDVFDPERWLDPNAEIVASRKRLLVPFGVGARRCPGFNAALYQMRLILAATIHAFDISLAPETTPQSMEPFEANGYRSRYDQCFLLFRARDGV